MSTQPPIPVNDNYLVNVLDNPAVRSMFPHLTQVREQFRQAKALCGTCGASSSDMAIQLDRVRSWLFGLSEPDMKKLKTILGVQTRTFVAYVVKANKTRQKMTR